MRRERSIVQFGEEISRQIDVSEKLKSAERILVDSTDAVAGQVEFLQQRNSQRTVQFADVVVTEVQLSEFLHRGKRSAANSFDAIVSEIQFPETAEVAATEQVGDVGDVEARQRQYPDAGGHAAHGLAEVPLRTEVVAVDGQRPQQRNGLQSRRVDVAKPASGQIEVSFGATIPRTGDGERTGIYGYDIVA